MKKLVHNDKSAELLRLQPRIKEEFMQVVPIKEVSEIMQDMPQADCPVVHHFGDGIYIREVTIPAGVLAVGHVQRFKQNNFLLSGKIAMITDDGLKLLEAPLFFVGDPGRKIGLVLETVVWQNIWPTDETDVEKLEEMYLDKSDMKQEEIKHIEYMLREADREDYNTMIDNSPFTHEQVKEQVENKADQTPMPEEWGSVVTVRTSHIEGKGSFLSWPVREDTIIGPARVDGKRTPLGRYVNHSISPNVKPELMDNGDIYFVAIRDISGCKGGSHGDEITIDYRETLKLSGVEL